MHPIERMLQQLVAQTSPEDIGRELQRQALRETALYVKRNMRNVHSVWTQAAVHDVALQHVTLDGGLAMEFGVYSGTTINYIAANRDWEVHGFDSFEGLPEAWRDGFDRGTFKMDGLPEVRDNVRLHKGWFCDTLPAFLDALPDRQQPVAYLHVDCDLYSSTKTIFQELDRNIVPGTVIVFDEYFNYDGWEDGEFKAFQEFVAQNKASYRYLTYNSVHQQVAVLITGR